MGKPATIEFDNWRFYEDGTENGSTPIANQDTNVTGRNVDSDSQVQLRVLLQETNGGSGDATDDYGLEYALNAGGTPSWVAVTGASAVVQADTGSSLTDGGATTNRGTNGITGGSGTFVAGEQEAGNGVIEDNQITASNYTESVWGLILVSADLSNGDTIDFRVTRNGGTPGVTENVVPRITVSKTVTDVFFENQNKIEQGMKPNTAAGMGGILVE